MSWSGGPVNWDLASSLATQTTTEGEATDPPVTADESTAVAEACRLKSEHDLVVMGGVFATAATVATMWAGVRETARVVGQIDGRVLAHAETGGSNPSHHLHAEENAREAIGQVLAAASYEPGQVGALAELLAMA